MTDPEARLICWCCFDPDTEVDPSSGLCLHCQPCPGCGGTCGTSNGRTECGAIDQS